MSDTKTLYILQRYNRHSKKRLPIQYNGLLFQIFVVCAREVTVAGYLPDTTVLGTAYLVSNFLNPIVESSLPFICNIILRNRPIK